MEATCRADETPKAPKPSGGAAKHLPESSRIHLARSCRAACGPPPGGGRGTTERAERSATARPHRSIDQCSVRLYAAVKASKTLALMSMIPSDSKTIIKSASSAILSQSAAKPSHSAGVEDDS